MNLTRTELVWTYGRILCICELGRGHNQQCISCFNELIISRQKFHETVYNDGFVAKVSLWSNPLIG